MEMVNFRINKSKVFIVTGSGASGKDYVISAIRDLAKNKAMIVTKRTSRNQKPDDEDELICKNIIDHENSTEKALAYKKNPSYDMIDCNIKYNRRGNTYGIKTSEVWEGLQKGMFQVISLSEEEAINKMIRTFGGLVVLIYVHSNIPADDYDVSFSTYVKNMDKYDHVLIFEDKKEDLYDQVFRLLHYYEK